MHGTNQDKRSPGLSLHLERYEVISASQSRGSVHIHQLHSQRSPSATLFLTSKVPKSALILLSHLPSIRLLPMLLIWIDIEAPRIAMIPDRRNNRPTKAPVIDIIPIDALEERVRFNARCAAADVAQAVGSVNGAEFADDVLCFGGEGRVGREGDGFGDDSVGGGGKEGIRKDRERTHFL